MSQWTISVLGFFCDLSGLGVKNVFLDFKRIPLFAEQFSTYRHTMKTFEGSMQPPTGRFAIVAARFNETVVNALLSGAVEAFRRYGVGEDRIDLFRVPGSFEIPVVARRIAKKYAAVVCLGCVIRGDTDHYDHVAGAATSGIAAAAAETGVPIIFGVLTTETLEQAVHRAGGKAGNKGAEAALTAIEMANLLTSIS